MWPNSLFAKKVIVLSGFSIGAFQGTRSFELTYLRLPLFQHISTPKCCTYKPWYRRFYSFTSCVATASSPFWILTNTLNSVLKQESVKNQLYRREWKEKFSFALISGMKSKLQSAEYEWELSILDRIFLKPKQSCLAASDKNYRVSVPSKEYFPSRAMDSFTS